jgi:hypothetical protein
VKTLVLGGDKSTLGSEKMPAFLSKQISYGSKGTAKK